MQTQEVCGTLRDTPVFRRGATPRRIKGLNHASRASSTNAVSVANACSEIDLVERRLKVLIVDALTVRYSNGDAI
jgi:hypothetical protein